MAKIQTTSLKYLEEPSVQIKKNNLVAVSLLFSSEDNTGRTSDIFARKLCISRDAKTGLTAKQSKNAITEILAINLKKNELAKIPVFINKKTTFAPNHIESGFSIDKDFSLEDASEKLGLETDPERNFFKKDVGYKPLTTQLSILNFEDALELLVKKNIDKNDKQLSTINSLLQGENKDFISGNEVIALARAYEELNNVKGEEFWKKELGEQKYSTIVKKQNQPKPKENVFDIFENGLR